MPSARWGVVALGPRQAVLDAQQAQARGGTSSRARRRTSAGERDSQPAQLRRSWAAADPARRCGRADRVRQVGVGRGVAGGQQRQAGERSLRACRCRSVGGCATTRVLRPAPESTAAQRSIVAGRIGVGEIVPFARRARRRRCARQSLPRSRRCSAIRRQGAAQVRRTAKETASSPSLARRRNRSARRRSARLDQLLRRGGLQGAATILKVLRHARAVDPAASSAQIGVESGPRAAAAGVRACCSRPCAGPRRRRRYARPGLATNLREPHGRAKASRQSAPQPVPSSCQVMPPV